MTLSEHESAAIEAFEQLGLTSYEAQVFIGLHRLGTGTARDVASVSDVPRSQVYSVAESLEERGLVEVQQASPRRFRPVGVDHARAILRDRFENQQDRAFDFVETVREKSEAHEEQESVWTVRGRERITSRIVDLIMTADERIILGLMNSSFFTDEIDRALRDRSDGQVPIQIVSADEALRDRLKQYPTVETTLPPEERRNDKTGSRALFVDDDSILMAVMDDAGNETAIWSSGSLLASVFIQLVTAGEAFGREEADGE